MINSETKMTLNRVEYEMKELDNKLKQIEFMITLNYSLLDVYLPTIKLIQAQKLLLNQELKYKTGIFKIN